MKKNSFLFYTVIIIWCVSFVGCLRVSNTEIIKDSLVEPTILANTLILYKTALESKDIDLFISLFSQKYQDGKGSNREALKKYMQTFFDDYTKILVDIESVNLKIGNSKISGAVISNGDYPFDIKVNDKVNSANLIHVKGSINAIALENKKESLTAAMSVFYEINAVPKNTTAEAYHRTFKKELIFCKIDGEWKIESEKILEEK